MKTSIKIPGERLLTCIQWLAWARHYLAPSPTNRKGPSGGYAERAQVQALVERYNISATIYAKPDFWADIGDVLTATPALRSTEIDLDHLLARLTRNTAESELHLSGFIRFLQAVACGELIKADLLSNS